MNLVRIAGLCLFVTGVLRAQPLVARRRQKLRRSVIVGITFTVENA